MPRTIHISSPSPEGGFGNRLDLELVAALLESNGFEVVRRPVTNRGKWSRGRYALRRLFRRPRRFDINLFLSPIFPEWLPLARRNVLVPNLDGFGQPQWLPRIDLVLAKTRETERIFRGFGCRTEFTSFTSPDCLDESVPRDPVRFFHCCSSETKGTGRLLATWMRHPEWPELVAVINHAPIPDDIAAPNIRLIRRRLPQVELRRLQNSFRFHICCSEAEGFGHYLMEAMSCRAVTFTTDGPPMNELVRPGRGLLVDCVEGPALRATRRYLLRPESLEARVEEARRMDAAEANRIGRAGREFYLENDRFFRQRLPEILKEI